MSLRTYLSGVGKELDQFLALAGRPNATVIALQANIRTALDSGDRALDVEDPRELQRGFKPATPPPSPAPPEAAAPNQPAPTRRRKR